MHQIVIIRIDEACDFAGKTICTGSEDGSFRVWNPRSGESTHVVQGDNLNFCCTILSENFVRFQFRLCSCGRVSGIAQSVISIDTYGMEHRLSFYLRTMACSLHRLSSLLLLWFQSRAGFVVFYRMPGYGSVCDCWL